VWCWGYNGDGELGDGTTTSRATPAQVGAATTYGALSAGSMGACGGRTDATVWCWGRNNTGVFGIGTTTLVNSSPVQVASSVAGGDYSRTGTHGCLVKTNGTLVCAGSNTSGQLGAADWTGAPASVAGAWKT